MLENLFFSFPFYEVAVSGGANLDGVNLFELKYGTLGN